MDGLPLEFPGPVTLVGGGVLSTEMLDAALAVAPTMVAADGAAGRLRERGLMPAAVIGDMDSLGDPAPWRDGPARLVHLAEQDTTDFEKCLYATEAPFYVGAGFTGRRADHTLAVLHAMLRQAAKPVFLLSEVEVITLMPAGRRIGLDLDAWTTVSLYPLVPVRGVASSGLRWDIAGLDFAPGTQIGTSNRATEDRVEIEVGGPGMLLIVDRRYLAVVIDAVLGTARGR